MTRAITNGRSRHERICRCAHASLSIPLTLHTVDIAHHPPAHHPPCAPSMGTTNGSLCSTGHDDAHVSALEPVPEHHDRPWGTGIALMLQAEQLRTEGLLAQAALCRQLGVTKYLAALDRALRHARVLPGEAIQPHVLEQQLLGVPPEPAQVP